MPRKKKPPAASPTECPACSGAGTVAVAVRVGRHRRNVGQQEGICMTCLGSGTAADTNA